MLKTSDNTTIVFKKFLVQALDTKIGVARGCAPPFKRYCVGSAPIFLFLSPAVTALPVLSVQPIAMSYWRE